jgi:hypothetical protein
MASMPSTLASDGGNPDKLKDQNLQLSYVTCGQPGLCSAARGRAASQNKQPRQQGVLRHACRVTTVTSVTRMSFTAQHSMHVQWTP